MEPLLHVAVASLKALEPLRARVQNGDLGDVIGKTPLVLAAQHDPIKSERLLLAHHVAANATTMERAMGGAIRLRTTLAHARSGLHAFGNDGRPRGA